MQMSHPAEMNRLRPLAGKLAPTRFCLRSQTWAALAELSASGNTLARVIYDIVQTEYCSASDGLEYRK